jgi:hypothetical protein
MHYYDGPPQLAKDRMQQEDPIRSAHIAARGGAHHAAEPLHGSCGKAGQRALRWELGAVPDQSVCQAATAFGDELLVSWSWRSLKAVAPVQIRSGLLMK